MKFHLFIAFISVPLFASSQQYYVYSISPKGAKETLTRKEKYENGLLTKKEFVTPSGSVSFEVKFKYDAFRQMTKRVETHFEETPFDIIREFTYDQKGRKSGELFGNNRTGKWGSYRFTYDDQDRLDSTYVYAKNGDLIGYRIAEFSFNSSATKAIETRKNIELDGGLSQITSVIIRETLGKQRVKTTTQTADGAIVMIEDVFTNLNDLPVKKAIAVEAGKKEILFLYYDTQNRLKRTENFISGTPESTAHYRYDANDILIEKRFEFADGFFSGEIFSLSENEVIGSHQGDFAENKSSPSKKLFFQNQGAFQEGLAWVKMDHKRFYYIKENGQPLIHYTFDRCYDFSEGLARVLDFNDAKGYAGEGFINTSGEVVIPLQFDRATDFKDGKAQVWQNEATWWIDRKGQQLEQ